MTDLTQKILSLDLEVASALKDANAASIEAKKEADMHVDQQWEEVQKDFKEQKNREEKVLLKMREEERRSARDQLDQKKKTFDENVKIDALVEDLIEVAKERICR